MFIKTILSLSHTVSIDEFFEIAQVWGKKAGIVKDIIHFM